MPKAEDMNTINADGKAWDGRRGPIVVAGLFNMAVFIGLIIAIF